MDLIGGRMRCPYSENHLVDPLRMPYHLMKCRKNFPNVRLAVCPYSALHEMPPVELQYHMANCPDKRLVEGVDPPHALLHALSGKEPNMLKGCTDIPPPVNVKFDGDDTENWDDDIHDTNQEYPSPHPLIHPRRRLHHGDEANSLYPSRNTLPADFQVRRPISHSVAERLKPETNCDSFCHDPSSERQSNSGSSDSNSDFEAENRLYTQSDRLSSCRPATRPKSDNSPEASAHRIPEYTTTGKDATSNETNHKPILHGRGRSSLLACLDDSSRGDYRRPGSIKPQSFSMMGRGRFLSKIQANQ